MSSTTLVIGGGIQGVTAALALAERGIPSTIVEGTDSLLSRASVRNEGKVHLGFVYAFDPSGMTVRQMVTGALTFGPLLERWCGPIDWAGMRSEPFAYVVMPDSLLCADALAEHYARVGAEIESLASDLGADYCGTDPRVQAKRGQGEAPGFAPSTDHEWFATPEISLDPRALCSVLDRAVAANPLIEVRTNHRVTAAERTATGFDLTCDTPDGPLDIAAEQVLNCAWQGRAALDALAGLRPEQLIYRIKHQVIVRPRSQVTPDISPITMVQGPYGDVVSWPGPEGDIYLSWYPSGRTFIGSEPVGSETPDPAIAETTLSQLSEMLPALSDCRVVDHAPAYILAPDAERAGSDIAVSDSPLHDRSPMEVVRSGDESVAGDVWWSLRSYKLTTAPLVSERGAEQVAEALGSGARNSV